MKNSPKIFNKKQEKLVWGFTLPEIIISVAVIGILVLIMVDALSSFRRSAELNRAVDSVLAQLKDARRFTIESRSDSRWGVHIASTTSTLFMGGTYVAGAPANEVYTLPATVAISSTALQGGGVDVVFKRLSGETDQFGTVSFSSPTGPTTVTTIRILSSGLIEVQ